MWLIGKASKEEIDQMEEQGWEVQIVVEEDFNKALDPEYDPDTDLDLEDDGEQTIAVYVDEDVSEQLDKWNKEFDAQLKREAAMELAAKGEALEKNQKFVAADTFSEYDLGDDIHVVETENPVHDGDNCVVIRFYWEGERNPEDSSRAASFIVHFKPGTDIVNDFYSNL